MSRDTAGSMPAAYAAVRPRRNSWDCGEQRRDDGSIVVGGKQQTMSDRRIRSRRRVDEVHKSFQTTATSRRPPVDFHVESVEDLFGRLMISPEDATSMPSATVLISQATILPAVRASPAARLQEPRSCASCRRAST